MLSMLSFLLGMSNVLKETSPHLGALPGACVDVDAEVALVTFSLSSILQQTPIFFVFGRRQIVGKYLQNELVREIYYPIIHVIIHKILTSP